MNKTLFALIAAIISAIAVFVLVRALDRASTLEEISIQPASETKATTVTETATTLTTSTASATHVDDKQTSFAKKLQEIQSGLTTVEQVRALPPEAKHRIPEVVLKSGMEIADVAAAIEKDPSLAPQGIEFYGNCAKRTDLAGSLRSTCLARLRALAKKTGAQVDERGISPEVMELVDELHSAD